MRMLLGDVLRQADDLPCGHELYASPEAVFDESLPVLVWGVDEVDDEADLPDEAIELGYEYALGMQDVQSIVSQEEAARS